MSLFLEYEVKNFLRKRTLCLIGFMGAGKTYFGDLLSDELNIEVISTDELIEENENMPILDIFRKKGEKYFRSVEKKILQDIVFKNEKLINNDKTPKSQIHAHNSTTSVQTNSCDNHSSAFFDTGHKIIVTGGGLPLGRTNQKLLKLLDIYYIYLNPPFDTIFMRIKGSKRPLIYRRSRQSIFNLWAKRYKIYQNLADITIPSTNIEEMFKILNQRVSVIMNNPNHLQKTNNSINCIPPNNIGSRIML